MKKTNMLFVLAAALLLALGVWQFMRTDRIIRAAAASPKAVIAERLPVPVRALTALDGKEYTIGGARSKPMVINFWASWCGPCHEEAPALERIYERYGGQFDLYAVNVTKGDRLKDAKAFAHRYGLQFPILLDKTGQAAEDYRILFVPTSFLIDSQGRLVETIHVLPPEELEQKIKHLIERESAAGSRTAVTG
ncbi:Thiol-disulfide isomerase or thioredoxin [Paenibacillus sp. UNCCL117]|uniref:TlpA family protein disulfide reductase n=1 Tax=unclassified Paenibacillus TaxID=185978 RepID=UPI000888D44D|nr:MULTISPECIES: TlpA disulfide reductase family protein [unclassified Paenibacillus]SDC22692.1 Thiol-disulfide isomerase or thioredoxin [Paenibacillus sp. cl123]SFW19105.1 Thiol-disulfide isomerase or thioredoxin [Paenibacillus sp. UNCCL117]